MIRISCGCRNAEPGRPHHLGERPSIRRKNYAKPGKDQPHGAVHQPGLLFPGHAQFRQKGIRFRIVQFPMTAAGRAIVPDSRGGNHHSRRSCNLLTASTSLRVVMMRLSTSSLL